MNDFEDSQGGESPPSCKKCAAFVADLAHVLAAQGLRHWQGKAAYCPGSPRERLICINRQGVLHDLTVASFDAGIVQTQTDLVRCKTNCRFELPRSIRAQLRDLPRGKKLEITCKRADLHTLLSPVSALLLGQTIAHRNYVWDPRAALTLRSDDQDRFNHWGLTGLNFDKGVAL